MIIKKYSREHDWCWVMCIHVRGRRQDMSIRSQCDICVYWTYQMLIAPELLQPQPPPPPVYMYQCSHHVICTKIQHCDTHSAVFAHVASRLATTNYHRPMLTGRASVKTSKNRPLRGATAHSPANFGSGVSLQLQNLTWWWPVTRAKRG